jgi:hypothetical protein
MCVGDAATYELEVISFLNFTTDVSLSSAGGPPNSTSTFGDTVLPPGTPIAPSTTTLTISTTTSTPIGSYNVQVSGSTSATDSQTIILPIDVIESPGQASPVSPANNSTLVSTTPVLSWTPSITVGNVTYVVEVATDANFTNIVYTATVASTTNHQVTTPLDFNTQYYWRVNSPQNICGTGATSQVFTFRTVSEITVTKKVGTDPNPTVCAPTSDITVPSGTSVYYCLVVANNTSLTFTTHTLSDPNLNLTATFPFTLSPGAVISVTNNVLTSALGLPPGLGPITATTDMTNTVIFTASDGVLTFSDTATATVRIGLIQRYLPLLFKN